MPREAQVRPLLGMCPQKGSVRVSELHLNQLRGVHVCGGHPQKVSLGLCDFCAPSGYLLGIPATWGSPTPTPLLLRPHPPLSAPLAQTRPALVGLGSPACAPDPCWPPAVPVPSPSGGAEQPGLTHRPWWGSSSPVSWRSAPSHANPLLPRALGQTGPWAEGACQADGCAGSGQFPPHLEPGAPSKAGRVWGTFGPNVHIWCSNKLLEAGGQGLLGSGRRPGPDMAPWGVAGGQELRCWSP